MMYKKEEKKKKNQPVILNTDDLQPSTKMNTKSMWKNTT